MNCKKCNAELAEDELVCHVCGFEQDDELVSAEEKVTAEEQVSEAEMPDFEGDPVEIAEESTPIVEGKLSAGKITLLVVLAVAAIAVVLALIIGGLGNTNLDHTGTDTTSPDSNATAGTIETTPATIPADGNPDDVTCKGSYSVSDEVLAENLETIVATAGDLTLSNRVLQIYYWMQFYDFLDAYSSYASYLGLDASKPLDTQISLDNVATWQQFLLDGAINSWRNYAVMSMEADKAGFEMDQDYVDFLNDQPANLEQTALSYGYSSVDEMIQADMGPGADLDAYMTYMTTYYKGYLYYASLLNEIVLTDAEVEAYYDEHAEEYEASGVVKDDQRYVDVRHILIKPTGGTTGENGTVVYSDAEWEACRVAAQEVLDLYLAGDLTEEHFSELCAQYSADGNASTGGLYTDVYVGQMVEPFEEWCFDDSRQYGDTGLVQTRYGYHVMFFVDSRYIWFSAAEEDLRVEKNDEILEMALEAYPLEVEFGDIVLGVIDLHKEG